MTTRFHTCSRALLTALAVAAFVLLSVNGLFAAEPVKPLLGPGEQKDNSLRMKADPQPDAGNFRRATMFARANYVWPYSAGPRYGQLDASQVDEPGVLQTRVGALKLVDVQTLLPAELKSGLKFDRQAQQYFIVSIHPDAVGSTLPTLETTLASSGGAIVDHMRVSAAVVRMNAATHEAVQRLPGVLGVEPYHAAFKLDPRIGRTPLPDPLKALSEVYQLDVQLFKGEDAGLVAQKLTQLGGNVMQVFAGTILVEINRAQLGALASLEPVSAVTEHLPLMPHAEETTTVMQTGRMNNHAIPYHDAGIDGSGNGVAGTTKQVLMELDSGISIDAGDLSDTRVNAGAAGAGHRKVRLYASTSAFGGVGDLLGCDSPQQGGFTHGHMVATTALGNATDVPIAYGAGFQAFDQQGNPWKLDGVAPGAVLIAYDGQVTPGNVSCADPLLDTISPGDLYAGPAGGSLGAAYAAATPAKVVNFSWGADSNTYGSNSTDIDDFISDKLDAMVFVSAGNQGEDADTNGFPDEGTLGTPATTKNGLAIGAASAADDPGAGPETRAVFSSMGPAVDATVNRVAPQLMAPGNELGAGTLGLSSEFSCRSSDNDQVNPVECDIVSGVEGTSFASPAAAGTALLVRDYFAQGFYPSGAQVTADQALNVSGALVKATLLASADFMTGGNLARTYRWNNEQGAGRIQLDNVLPLATWPASPTGLIVGDGGIPGGENDTGLAGSINATVVSAQTQTFQVCDTEQELRVALAWVETSGAALLNDLDLEITSPDPPGPGLPKTYYGNYFTDDDNKNLALDGGEDCPGHDGTTLGLLDQEEFSLAACGNSDRDNKNPTELIVLSPDLDGDGLEAPGDPTPADDNQVISGTWTITIRTKAGGANNNQRYAVVLAGGVCIGSSVRFDSGVYTCNDRATVIVNEYNPTYTGTPGSCGAGDCPTAAVIDTRVTLQVLDPNNVVVDTEDFQKNPATEFTQPDTNNLRFVSPEIPLSGTTDRQSRNQVLDVRDGDTIKVTYVDTTATRTSTSQIDCAVNISFGAITFGQFNMDTTFDLNGGCDRNARGQFEFGYPDRYIDSGEELSFRFAFASAEQNDLEDVQVTLRCVDLDADSPATCLPNSTDCADPKRLNNTSCDGGLGGGDFITVLDSPKSIGFLPAGSAVSANFALQAAANIPGKPKVELILEVRSATSGKTAAGIAISRHQLDVDESSTFYSTDFPLGGTNVVVVDRDNDERIDGSYPPSSGGIFSGTPTFNPGVFLDDYQFEQRNYGNMTATGRNKGLQSPWHFDSGNGGFKSGISSISDESLINPNPSQWGEDKNFNDILDGVCQRGVCSNNPLTVCDNNGPCGGGATVCVQSQPCTVFPTDPVCPVANQTCLAREDRDFAVPANQFDQNWSTTGGCGWQTRAPNSCSTITTRGCHSNRDCLGRCTTSVVPDIIPDSNTACTVNGDCPTTGRCNVLTAIPCTTNPDCVSAGAGTTCVFEACRFVAGNCTGPAQATGGVWHTGRIGVTTGTCMVNGSNIGQCQRYEAIGGTTGARNWFELLVTPTMEKVNQGGGECQADTSVACTIFPTDPVCPNANEQCDPTHTIEISDWGWNALTDLPDTNVAITWEFDTDVTKIDPVDIVSDGVFLNSMPGKYGAFVNSGNAQLTDGFPIFAAVGQCAMNPKSPCRFNADCPTPGGNTCNYVGNTTNGSVGPNRVGKNGCFFEGNALQTTAMAQAGLARPIDDDRDNDTPVDGLTDEFVTIAGPRRNMDIFAFNGLDMRLDTLEDIYGPTGNTFRGALGMLNLEATTTPVAAVGYGIAIDDMEVGWREFRLVDDTTDCNNATTGGRCAALQLDATNFFRGSAALTIRVLDSKPYGTRPIPGTGGVCVDCIATPGDAACKNDCNDNNLFTDGVDDNDCNNNGTPDVVVKVTSAAEPLGELAYLDRTTSPEYKGEITISALYDAVGVLFISPQGFDPAEVLVTYEDHEDGACHICQNDPEPTQQGLVQVATSVFIPLGNIVVVNADIDDDNVGGTQGDNDKYADTGETVDMRLRIRNPNPTAVNGLTLRLATNDSKIDCIVEPFLNVGSVPAQTTLLTTNAFRFKVKDDANRTSLNQSFSALFNITMASEAFDALFQPTQLTLDLDLNVVNGATPGTFTEGFETNALSDAASKFTNQNLDLGLNSEVASEGYRCQYSDPDWINSNSYGAITDCWLGATPAQVDATYWAIQPTTEPSGGRAFSGTHSLYYGIALGSAQGFTTPLAIVEAVRVKDANAIRLSGLLNSELTFKQQISLSDTTRLIATPAGEAVGRGVVMLRLADPVTGVGTGDWTKLQPYINAYDQQGTDNFFECVFDPVDDGNNEDSFFDPSDPERRLGPSSTCNPEFAYAWQGHTMLFSATALGGGTEGPGLAGVPGTPGTWLTSTFDLSRFRGRTIQLRFLATDIKVSTVPNYEDLFGLNTPVPSPLDDGWWIDDVTVSNTLVTAATLSVDNANLNGANCPAANCTSVVPVLVTDPVSGVIGAPGQTVELDATTTTTPGGCVGGAVQFRFCIDGNNDGLAGGGVDTCDAIGGADTLLRSWTDDPVLVDAPTVSGNYVVEARCSSLTTCKGTLNRFITVTCPGEMGTITFPSKTVIEWTGGAKTIDWYSGSFTTANSICGPGAPGTCTYPGACQPPITDTTTPMQITGQAALTAVPASNSGFWYLLKRDGTLGTAFCNSPTWKNAPATRDTLDNPGSENDRDGATPGSCP